MIEIFLHSLNSSILSSLNFIQAMVDNDVSASTKVSKLMTAIETHRAATLDAVRGQAFDRHLLGLKMQALENGENIPELFMDISYMMASHFKLSTSQGRTSWVIGVRNLKLLGAIT